MDPSKTTSERVQYLKHVAHVHKQLQTELLAVIDTMFESNSISSWIASFVFNKKAKMSFPDSKMKDIEEAFEKQFKVSTASIKTAYDKGRARSNIETAKSPRRKASTVGTSVSFTGSTKGAARLQSLANTSFEALRGETKAKVLSAVQRAYEKQTSKTSLVKTIKRLLGVSKYRASMIAVTEITRAQAEGQLDELEDLGEFQVRALVEFKTKDDERVCDECSGMEGLVYTIEQARGVIPVHPNCRCAWIPFDGDYE